MPFCHDENHVQTSVFFNWTFECERLLISRAESKIQKEAEKTYLKQNKEKGCVKQDIFYWSVLRISSDSKDVLRSQTISSAGESFVSQESNQAGQ